MTNRMEVLFEAIARDDYDRARSLVIATPSISKQEWDATTALHFAAANSQDPRLVKLLLEHGAALDYRNSAGNTPLHLACAANNRIMVSTLLKQGACLEISDANGRLPRIPQELLVLAGRAAAEEGTAITR